MRTDLGLLLVVITRILEGGEVNLQPSDHVHDHCQKILVGTGEADKISQIKTVLELFDHCCDDVVYCQLFYPLIFCNGWPHANNWPIRVNVRFLTFLIGDN